VQGESVPKRGVPQPIRGGPIKFGPYLLEARIAVGGTAEVYLARPIPPETEPPRLIVKRLLPHFLSDPEGRTMFEREAALHTAVQHENVVEVFGSGLSDTGEPYLAMEYVDGVDAYRLLRRFRNDGKSVPTHVAVHIVSEVLRALQSVHSAADPAGTPLGIIHRDVTPSNLYLSKDGKVKLGDFGIARSTQRTTMRNAASAMLKGKIAYLAPEQVAGEPFDYRADLFSVATVLTEMLIGKPLFPGAGQLAILLAIRDCRIEPLREARANLPTALFDTLVRALSRDPAARFQSAAEFAQQLAPLDPTPAATRKELGIYVGRAQATPSTDQLAAVRAGARAVRTPPEPATAVPAPPRLPSVVSGSVPPIPPTKRPAPPLPPRRNPPPVLEEAIELDPSVTIEEDAPSEQKTAEYAPLPSNVETSNGEHRGPWSFARLVEAIATGEIGARDRVAYMGGEMKAIEEVDELLRFLPAKTSTTNRLTGPGAPDYHDDLHTTSMTDVLLRILEAQDSGVLFVEGLVDGPASGGRKELYVKNGKLLHVASNNASELLGEYLVGRGALKREELDLALTVLPRYGGRMGDTLIALGLVGPVDIFRAIREQGRDRVADIFRWKHGTVSFYRGHAPPHVEFPLDLELPELVLAGLEAASPDDTPLEAFKDRMDHTLVRGPYDRRGLTKGVKWPPMISGVLGLCNAPITVRDLLQKTCGGVLGSGDVLRAVEILLASHLVSWGRP
jgi:serine/threonine protein kinase